MGRKPKRMPNDDIPDSLPKRDDGIDVGPDDRRRSDRSERTPPDSLPPLEDEQSIEGAGRCARGACRRPVAVVPRSLGVG